tara:strand:- start:131 stop:316 length:186 start_codon:yes stop_codon:yes gene_type:complete
MFEQFKIVDEKHEFEIVQNGFILRVNGRDQNDNWLCKSYVFGSQATFFAAISALTEKDVVN